ncbi:MAG: beta-eliminating lyase-related protein, partial [Actinomycetota bacterium]|nr:beta-eliminating lyase-related protein [Actinomycetota bacterium]
MRLLQAQGVPHVLREAVAAPLGVEPERMLKTLLVEAALHLDGARLWECAPAYGSTWHGLGALADSVYVSLYKGLGANAGAVLLGDADLVAQARTWRHRHGTLPALWPLALGACRGLR